MKVFVTGADGQLGKALMKCKSEKYEICGYSKKMCNIVDYNQVLKICTMVGVFAVVTNCPLTALILGLKMGEFSVVILPLTIVLVTLYFILKFTKHHSIYKDLVKRLPNLEVH